MNLANQSTRYVSISSRNVWSWMKMKGWAGQNSINIHWSLSLSPKYWQPGYR